MPRCVVVVSLLAVLAPPLRPQPALPDVIARMEAAAGLGAGPSPGDCVLTGVLTLRGQSFNHTVAVRREPFGYREELRWIPTAPDAAPPAGVPRHAVYFSDGEQCWKAADELGPEGPLTGGSAVAVLDNALLFRLLLDPRAALEWGTRHPPRLVTAEAEPVVADEEVVYVAWHHGTTWGATVERSSGRLTGLFDTTKRTQRWFLLSEWQVLEGGATFPALIEVGERERRSSELRSSSLLAGQVLPSSTFPAGPAPALGAVEDVASLKLVPDQIPGTLAVVVPGCQLFGGRGLVRDVWTLLDTGASGLYLDAHLAEPLGLPLLGGQTTSGLFGSGDSDWLWVDRLQLGRHPVLQIPAATAALPVNESLPREHPVGLLLGGPRLMALSPILDLRARRLLLRGLLEGGRVRPLSEIAGRAALTVPLVTDSHDQLRIGYALGGVSATAVLDTALPYVARLSRADMRHLGLPLDDDEWVRRGALGVNIGGAQGRGELSLIVRMDQDLLIGPVALQRPVIVLRSEQAERDELAADVTLIGMGAFSAFEQVGFDRGRLLELVPPASFVQLGEPPRVVVPAVEDHLGFDLQPAERSATSRPHNLPRVTDVLSDMPAGLAGLRDGDFLAEVDGMACDGVPPMDVWDWLRPRGRTELRLTVLRKDELLHLVIRAPAADGPAR